jgi:protease-4
MHCRPFHTLRCGFSAVVLLALSFHSATQTGVSAAEPGEAGSKTLAVFRLSSVSESAQGDDMPFGGAAGESLRGLIGRLEKAADDDKIAGIVLLADGASMGRAQAEEVHQALGKFKKAGKKIHAHCDSLSTGKLFILAQADQISVVPTGDVWINGLYGESPYLLNLFNMLGIEPDFLTCGDYKSAAEMFTRSAPSPAAQENTDWLLDGIYENMVATIAEGRNADVAKVKSWIDVGLYSAEKAQKIGVIDSVQHQPAFVNSLRKTYGEDVKFDKRYGKKKAMDIDFSSPFGVMKFYADLLAGPKKTNNKGPVIAIIHVEGPIMTGSASADPLSLFSSSGAFSTPIRKALLEAADDDNIKAVVLRVDSPGGSAVASEIVLDATKQVAAKKPLVISMGNVAGSGGYYVACGSKVIFADPSTITGSIGVVSGKLATGKLWSRVGVNWSSTKRGKNADILNTSGKFSDEQRELMEMWMNEIYDVFKGHVVAIRGDKLAKPIDELAGGRVYTGKQALELGLIDKLGGIEDALTHAAGEAGLKDYRVQTLPGPVNFIDVLLGTNSEDDDPSKLELSGKQVQVQSPAMTRAWANQLFSRIAPELAAVDPDRVTRLRKALLMLSILRDEGVSMHMPLYGVR